MRLKSIQQNSGLSTGLVAIATLLSANSAQAGGGGGHHFSWLQLVPGLEHAHHALPMAILVASILVITTLIARVQLGRAMKSAEGAVVPEAKLTYRNFFEIVAEKLFGLTESVMGRHEAEHFFPIIGTLFVYIFASNLIGLIPGFLPPTDTLNMTMALGLFVFAYYNYVGLRVHGIAYLKHFLGPVLWLAPLLLVIELASHIFRPISLALRLRGNIMGDHIVLGVFTELSHGILIPVVFYGIGLFVSFVQAFVFCLMTMVYISLSAAHDH
jgi:F-type H+-transporting ATPase subunit a